MAVPKRGAGKRAEYEREKKEKRAGSYIGAPVLFPEKICHVAEALDLTSKVTLFVLPLAGLAAPLLMIPARFFFLCLELEVGVLQRE